MKIKAYVSGAGNRVETLEFPMTDNELKEVKNRYDRNKKDIVVYKCEAESMQFATKMSIDKFNEITKLLETAGIDADRLRLLSDEYVLEEIALRIQNGEEI